jgi:hypothetical protein
MKPHVPRLLKICEAPKITTSKTTNLSITWEELAEKLSTPEVTQETFAEYCAMSKTQRCKIKDVGYFVGGQFKDGKRCNENNLHRDLLTLDYDENVPFDYHFCLAEYIGEYEYVTYTTHSHSPEDPRIRLVIPLTRSVTPEEYPRLIKKVDALVGFKDALDPGSTQPERAMFYPSHSKDAEFEFYPNTGAWLDPDVLLAEEPEPEEKAPQEQQQELTDLEAMTRGCTDLSTEQMKQILSILDPDMQREQWVRVGMALHHQFNGSAEGLQLFDGWSASKGSVKYESGDCAHRWNSFQQNPNNPTTFKSVIAMAQQVDAKKVLEIMRQTPPDAQKKPERPKFRLTLAADLLKDPQPLKWLVHKILPPYCHVLTFGEPGGGKSLATIDKACCIATGIPWHGRKVTQGGVIYIAGEGHFGIKRRLKAWSLKNGIDLTNAPLAVSDVGADLTDPNAAHDVIAAIDAFAEEYGNPALVIIDTLHRNLGAGDENSSQDIGAFYSHLDHIKNKYDCTTITVHHSGHAAKDRARGSSSLKATVDVEIQVVPNGKKFKMVNHKMKDHAKFEDIGFLIEPVALGWIDEDGEEETSVTIERSQVDDKGEKGKTLTPTLKLAIETLYEAIQQSERENAAHLETWRECFYKKHTGDSADTKRQAFNRAREKMTTTMLAEVEDDYYTLTGGTESPYVDAAGFIGSVNILDDFNAA